MNVRITHPPRPAGAAPAHQGAQPGPDDQATRLRALMQATARPAVAPRSGRADSRAQQSAPTRHRTELLAPRAKIVAFASGKGGVGKTSACVNLAIALSALGRRTTVLDADLGLANADVLCGVTPTKRLEHVVAANGGARYASVEEVGATSICELAIDVPGGFRLIPGAAGIARMAELTHDQRMRLFAGLVELERESDLLLVDASAGLGRDVITFTQIADLAVVVATPEPTSITDAYALIKCALTERPIARRAHHLRATGQPGGAGSSCEPAPYARLALVVNQVVDEREALAVHGRIAAACTRFLNCRLPLLGWIAQDARMSMAVRKRRPLLLDAPRSRAGDDLWRLARALSRAVEPDSTSERPRRRGLTGLLSRIILRSR